MGVQRLLITEFLQRARGHLILDVRSPGEFAHAHIPGAVSLPLFSDEERKQIGTAYKQQSREQAIKIGLDMFGPKMRGMVERVEELNKALANKDGSAESGKPAVSSPVFVHCWRGGMRSGAVAWLLDLYGFKVFTLAGGYKSYRNYVLEMFRKPWSFRILGGYTGSGKTEVLQELERLGEPVIDLEKIASHKGSAFGSFRMPPQPTQEMFENLLAGALEQQITEEHIERPSIWMEDESQRIGNLNIPTALWNTMRRSPLYFLDIPFEERLEHITEEYGACEPLKLIESVQRISQRLGGLEAKNTINWLEQGNFREAFRILLHYYDKRYIKGLHNREALSALLTTMPCARVSPQNAQVLTKRQPV